MTKPLVCCVMLTCDRPAEMVSRAVSCFIEQEYSPRVLLIFDTGTDPIMPPESRPELHYYFHRPELRGEPIGYLRNLANQVALYQYMPDLMAHWDDDDLRAPEYLNTLVGQLQADSAIDCVGFHEIPYYNFSTGDAWLYANRSRRYAVGNSIVYRSRAWGANNFPPKARIGEDSAFINLVRTRGFSSIAAGSHPLMVAGLHSSNLCARPRPTREWRLLTEGALFDNVREIAAVGIKA